MSNSDILLLSQLAWLSIFAIGMLCIGSCLAFILVYNQKRLGIDNNLFLASMGYAIVPYVLGTYMLLISFIPLKLPYFFYVVTPYIISVIVLAINRKKICLVLDNIKNKFLLVDKEYTLLGIVMALIIVIECILEQIYYLINNKLTFYFIIMLMCLLILGGIAKWILNDQKNCVFYMGIFTLGFICIFLKEILVLKNILLPFNMNYLCVAIQLGITIIIGALLLYHNRNYRKENQVKKRIFLCVYPILVLYLSIRFFLINRSLMRLCGDFVFGILLALLFLYVHSGKILEKVFIFIKYGTIFYFLVMILRGGIRPVWGSDATEYLSNALKYIETMSFAGINNFNGVSDGSLLAMIHHPGWVLYIAFGLLHTNSKVGFPNDYVARFAIQLCLVCLFLACLGLVSLFKKHNKPLLLAAILPMAYWGVGEIYQQHMRDAYRIIPLCFFIGLLIFIVQEKIGKNELKKGMYLIGFFICMFIMVGHPINAMQSVVIVIAFMIWLLMNRGLDKDVFLFGISCIVGAIVGAYQIIWAFLSTGKMTGIKIDIDKLLLNSDYYENYVNYTQSRLKGASNYYERLKLILMQDKGVLLIPAVCFAVIVLFCLIKKKDYKNKFVFLSIIVIIQSLMFTDIVSWSGGTLSEWCVMNYRYTLQIYVIYGLFLGIVLEKLFQHVNRYNLVKMCIICFSCIPIFILSTKWEAGERNQDTYSRLSEYVEINEAIAKTDGRILLDNYYCNYYLYDKGLSIFTDNAEKIRTAASLDKLHYELINANCTGILIMDSLRNVYWNDSLLEEYTESEKYIKEVIDTSFCTAYILK